MAIDAQIDMNEAFRKKKEKKIIRTKLTDAAPFPHCVFEDFLNNADVVGGIRAELIGLDTDMWKPKVNDLYSLDQTRDLAMLTSDFPGNYPNIEGFIAFLKGTFSSYLGEITGTQLSSEQLTVTGSAYKHTHNLLLHDDRVANRKFAFVYYLCEEFLEEDGGQLQLYNVNDSGEPEEVERTLYPKKNQFVVFEVSDKSWHRVAEVLSESKIRYSINGWFHVDAYPKHEAIPFVDPLNVRQRIADAVGEDEAEFKKLRINGRYLADEFVDQVRVACMRNSVLRLDNFFNDSPFLEALMKQLNELKFPIFGPPHKRHFGVLDENAIEEGTPAHKLLRTVRSEILTLFLERWTGTQFNGHEEVNYEKRATEATGTSWEKVKSAYEAEDFDYSNIEVVAGFRKYSAGCYTVMDDQLAQGNPEENVVDFRIFLSNDWDSTEQNESDHVTGPGGFLAYYAPEAVDAAFLHNPLHNQAIVVYRQADLMSFVKYINSRAGENSYYALECSYYGVKKGFNVAPLGSDKRNEEWVYEEDEDEGEAAPKKRNLKRRKGSKSSLGKKKSKLKKRA